MRDKIFIGNLDFRCTDAELRELVEPYGAVKEISMPVHYESAQWNRGFAFVTYKLDTAAAHAIDGLNSVLFHGRRLRVDWARPKSLTDRRSEAAGE